jgi:hypothetical protein
MKKNPIIVIVIVIVLVVASGAFYGGMAYAKSQRSKVNFGNFSGQRQGGNLSQAINSNGMSSGEILSLDDKSVTIKMRDNGSKIIFFSDSTKISKMVDGAVADLVVGQNLVVNGTVNSDGSISAASIQLRPADAVLQKVNSNANVSAGSATKDDAPSVPGDMQGPPPDAPAN